MFMARIDPTTCVSVLFFCIQNLKFQLLIPLVNTFPAWCCVILQITLVSLIKVSTRKTQCNAEIACINRMRQRAFRNAIIGAQTKQIYSRKRSVNPTTCNYNAVLFQDTKPKNVCLLILNRRHYCA
jgi:hypothetical protein